MTAASTNPALDRFSTEPVENFPLKEATLVLFEVSLVENELQDA
jgi:hypothetical protein